VVSPVVVETFPNTSTTGKENKHEHPGQGPLGMLSLAEEPQNISHACRKAGISRSHFYEIKKPFE
jgi:hypothetical protein